MANKAIKYRLYPTTEQIIMFAKTFGCCRKVYNLMLADKIESYKSTGRFVSVTPAKYKKEYPYLKEIDSLALANKQLDLQEAFRNYFSKSRKKKNGFPKFKSAKHSRKSYTTNCQYPKPSNNLKQPTIRLEKNRINLPKVGMVKINIHRMPKSDWILKSVTVSEESNGKYYASVLFEYEHEVTYIIPKENICTDNVIGLDYASDGLYVDDNGNIGTNHKYYRENHKKLAKAQKRLSHMQGSKKKETKSKNFLKQLKKVNKIHRHIANQRLDNLHKISTEIANQYDVVCVEDLNIKSMSNKGFGNGKATLDNGYGMFLNMLEYKFADRGKYFIKVDKWFASSQICHKCGTIHPEMKNLSKRIMKCMCGLVMKRDHNSEINIKMEGLRMLKSAL